MMLVQGRRGMPAVLPHATSGLGRRSASKGPGPRHASGCKVRRGAVHRRASAVDSVVDQRGHSGDGTELPVPANGAGPSDSAPDADSNGARWHRHDASVSLQGSAAGNATTGPVDNVQGSARSNVDLLSSYEDVSQLEELWAAPTPSGQSHDAADWVTGSAAAAEWDLPESSKSVGSTPSARQVSTQGQQQSSIWDQTADGWQSPSPSTQHDHEPGTSQRVQSNARNRQTSADQRRGEREQRGDRQRDAVMNGSRWSEPAQQDAATHSARGGFTSPAAQHDLFSQLSQLVDVTGSAAPAAPQPSAPERPPARQAGGDAAAAEAPRINGVPQSALQMPLLAQPKANPSERSERAQAPTEGQERRTTTGALPARGRPGTRGPFQVSARRQAYAELSALDDAWGVPAPAPAQAQPPASEAEQSPAAGAAAAAAQPAAPDFAPEALPAKRATPAVPVRSARRQAYSELGAWDAEAHWGASAEPQAAASAALGAPLPAPAPAPAPAPRAAPEDVTTPPRPAEWAPTPRPAPPAFSRRQACYEHSPDSEAVSAPTLDEWLSDTHRLRCIGVGPAAQRDAAAETCSNAICCLQWLARVDSAQVQGEHAAPKALRAVTAVVDLCASVGDGSRALELLHAAAEGLGAHGLLAEVQTSWPVSTAARKLARQAMHRDDTYASVESIGRVYKAQFRLHCTEDVFLKHASRCSVLADAPDTMVLICSGLGRVCAYYEPAEQQVAFQLLQQCASAAAQLHGAGLQHLLRTMVVWPAWARQLEHAQLHAIANALAMRAKDAPPAAFCGWLRSLNNLSGQEGAPEVAQCLMRGDVKAAFATAMPTQIAEMSAVHARIAALSASHLDLPLSQLGRDAIASAVAAVMRECTPQQVLSTLAGLHRLRAHASPLAAMRIAQHVDAALQQSAAAGVPAAIASLSSLGVLHLESVRQAAAKALTRAARHLYTDRLVTVLQAFGKQNPPIVLEGTARTAVGNAVIQRAPVLDSGQHAMQLLLAVTRLLGKDTTAGAALVRACCIVKGKHCCCKRRCVCAKPRKHRLHCGVVSRVILVMQGLQYRLMAHWHAFAHCNCCVPSPSWEAVFAGRSLLSLAADDE
jgi:hypothetical protein